VQNPKSVSL
jgi:dynein heavy chain